MTIQAETVRQVIHELVHSWHSLKPEQMAPVPYKHDGPYWIEFWDRAVRDPRDMRCWAYGFALLWPDIKAHEGMGQPPTPECIAGIYLLLYSREDALRAYLEWYLDQLQPPDQHVTYILLHPEILPEDFPMYRRRR